MSIGSNEPMIVLRVTIARTLVPIGGSKSRAGRRSRPANQPRAKPISPNVTPRESPIRSSRPRTSRPVLRSQFAQLPSHE